MGVESYGAQSPKMFNSAGETIYLLDYITGGSIQITTDHNHIHEGKFFETSIQKTLSSGGTYDLVMTTPASSFIHYRPSKVSTSADKLTIGLYENCSVSGGATVTPYNRNRSSTALTTVTVVSSANITSVGTLIHQSYIGGGSGIGGARSGAEIGQDNEWVLAQSTNYCFKVSNGSTGNNTVNINQVWYEEERG